METTVMPESTVEIYEDPASITVNIEYNFTIVILLCSAIILAIASLIFYCTRSSSTDEFSPSCTFERSKEYNSTSFKSSPQDNSSSKCTDDYEPVAWSNNNMNRQEQSIRYVDETKLDPENNGPSQTSTKTVRFKV